MEDLDYIEKMKAFGTAEDVLAVSRDVNELRSKFEDYTIEEERKVQVAEIEAEEANTAVATDVVERKDAIRQLKDDFQEAYQNYRAKKKEVVEAKNAEEAAHLSTKLALIKQLREVVTTEENIGAAFGALKEIQEKWKAIGPIPRNKQNDIETEYGQLLDDFFYNIKIYKELKDHDFHRNHQLKLELIDELKKLNALESMREVETQLKKLQNDWNDIGPVPNEEWEKLKEAYWTEVRSVYNKINRFYDDRRTQSLENLKQKEALVEEITALTADLDQYDSAKQWDATTKKVLDIQSKWKTIGFGPKKENEAIWKTFRGICDAFFTAKKAFYGTVYEQFDAIADQKKALIDKAKALTDSTDWKGTASQLKRLQNDWKKLGHAGVKYEQKLWKEFRGACDAFFNARNNHFNAQDKANEDNLKAKEALLKEIEAYKPATDKSQALTDLKQFAADFNAIGHVPLKQKDSIFKAFKAVMDNHYKALKMEGDEKDKVMFEAKLDTIKSSPNAHRLFNDLRFDLRKEIDKHTKEIAQLENNLGFFANSKGAESLKKDVEKKVNRAKAQIVAIKAKLKMIPNE